MALGLSLGDVERKSRGRWKAVVVGSYERADRTVTVTRLSELAGFYRVPLSSLLPEDKLPEGSAETVILATAIRKARIGPRDGRQAVQAVRRLLAAEHGTTQPDAAQGPEVAA